MKEFERLIKIMDELREQCPWDKKQNFQSLRSLTIEELYELTDAILVEDPQKIKEELGDVMLHLVFYSRLAKEQQWFDIEQVLQALNEKLIERHPHIYGDMILADEDAVKRNWEKIKMKDGKKGLLSGVPNGLPAIVKAYRLQEKTKQVGFEWDHIDQVWAKVEEEIIELQAEVKSGESKDKLELEFGDVLFALVNYARFLGIDPETSLERVNAKFKSRFEYIESQASKPLQEMTLDEMDTLWNEAKEME